MDRPCQDYTIRASFCSPVANFLGNTQVILKVEINIAESSIGTSFCSPVTDFFSNTQVLLVALECSLKLAEGVFRGKLVRGRQKNKQQNNSHKSNKEKIKLEELPPPPSSFSFADAFVFAHFLACFKDNRKILSGCWKSKNRQF